MYTHNNIQLNQKAMNPFIAPVLHNYITRTLHGDTVSATG